MANDVTIVVEASLGDTLIKLDLAKHGINELGDAATKNAAEMDASAASTALFTDALAGSGGGGGLIGSLTTAIPLLGGFSAPLIALPVVVIAAMTAIIALTSVIGTLTAIVADFVAPATLVVGLLGGLGAGFLFAGVSAAKGGGALQPFADKLATLHSMFEKTGNILAHAFLPYLLQLAGAAQQALLFIDKLAREPLAKAMHDMATQGVQMLNKFVEQVAHVVARPIRLAFQIAFGSGPGGNEFAQAVATWWHQFTGFLFGYTVRHPIELRPGVFKIESRTVDGIFTPIVDWFNRHHFTRQGIQIGREILNGLLNSTLRDRLGQFFATVFADAAKRATVAFFQVMFSSDIPLMRRVAKIMADALVIALQQAWNRIEQIASEIWSKIQSLAAGHINTIKALVIGLAGVFAGPLVAAVESVVGAIQGIVSGIETAIHAAETLANAISSIPNPFGGGGDPTHGGRAGARNPTGVQGPHVRGGVVVAHVHLHGIQWHDAGGRARIVHDFMAEMGRQQGRLADGH